jgi:hypothetical protein
VPLNLPNPGSRVLEWISCNLDWNAKNLCECQKHQRKLDCSKQNGHCVHQVTDAARNFLQIRMPIRTRSPRYTSAISSPPLNSELVEAGHVFWGLSKRLGIKMMACGVEVDMSRPPTADELLAIAARHAPVPFTEIKRHESGVMCAVEPQYVEPKNAGPNNKFSLMPDDVYSEMADLACENFAAPRRHHQPDR